MMVILLTSAYQKIITGHKKNCSQPPLDLKAIDKTWTLFIDRDGVINHEKKDEYIRNWK